MASCCCCSFLALCKLSKVLKVEGVGALNRQAEGPAPDLSWHDSEGAGDAEENSVEVVLSQAVVHQESTGAAVNVWPWVLDLASGVEALGDLLVVGLHELNQVVVLDVLVGVVKLAHESWVSLAKDCMAVAWNDLSRLERNVDELSDVLPGPVLTVLGLEVEQVVEAFLVGQAMQRASKTVHTS